MQQGKLHMQPVRSLLPVMLAELSARYLSMRSHLSGQSKYTLKLHRWRLQQATLTLSLPDK